MEATESTTAADPATNGSGNPGDVPLEGEEPGGEEMYDEIVLDGDGQLSLQIGGKRPTVSKVVIRGGAIPFRGQAMKGDHLTLEIEVKVAEVHAIDKIDSTTREVVETVRKHVLKIEGAKVVGT